MEGLASKNGGLFQVVYYHDAFQDRRQENQDNEIQISFLQLSKLC
jgi:hypothetical protein